MHLESLHMYSQFHHFSPPPTMKKKLSSRDIEIIIQSKKQNLTWKTIANIVGSKPETVRSAYKREIQKQLLPPKEKVSKSKINGRLSLHLKNTLEEDPFQTYSELSNKLKLECPNVSEAPGKHSVRRFMIKNGYNLSKLPKKPFISSINQEKRLIWSKNLIEKPSDFWDNIVWSDETMVRSNPQHKDLFVKVRKGEIRQKNLVNAKSQNEGVRVMFWGCFSKHEMGPLVAVDGILNGEKYKELLEKHLLPIFENSDRQLIFMQDNAPIHKSKLVTEFLADHGIPTIELPAQSPDLNPIENIWAILKAKRARQKSTPKTRRDLIDQMTELWANFEIDFRQNLSNSLPKRLSEVIKNKGKQTTY